MHVHLLRVWLALSILKEVSPSESPRLKVVPRVTQRGDMAGGICSLVL